MKADSPTPIVYKLCVRGEVDPTWSNWFGGLDLIPLATGDTLILGPLADQAALHGLLARVRDLGLELLSLQRLYPDPDSE